MNAKAALMAILYAGSLVFLFVAVVPALLLADTDLEVVSGFALVIASPPLATSMLRHVRALSSTM